MHFKSINNNLINIRTPRFIPRAPRDLKEINKLKANELLSFLIYYFLPLFKDVVSEEQLNHYTNLVVGIEYLLKQDTNHENLIL